MCLLSIRILLSYLVFGDDLEDVGGVLSTMELPLSDLVSQSAANLLESAVDLPNYKSKISRVISGAHFRRTGNSAAHRQKHAISKRAHDT